MRVILMAAIAAALPLAAASAQDQVAYQAIARADYASAETALVAQLAAGSREPGVLLNLAAVYQRTGRMEAATELYRAVRAEPNVQMALPNGQPSWSHDVASRGMTRARTMAAR